MGNCKDEQEHKWLRRIEVKLFEIIYEQNIWWNIGKFRKRGIRIQLNHFEKWTSKVT